MEPFPLYLCSMEYVWSSVENVHSSVGNVWSSVENVRSSVENVWSSVENISAQTRMCGAL